VIRAAAPGTILLLVITGCAWAADGPSATPTAAGVPSAELNPATRADGCAILVGGDDLVARILEVGHLPSNERAAGQASVLQDRLFTVVVAHNRWLGDAAGQLVDYLDDPDAYNRGPGTTAEVTRAVRRVRAICRPRRP
jgi:hypothetical protein